MEMHSPDTSGRPASREGVVNGCGAHMAARNEPVIIVVPFTDWSEWVLDCVRHCAGLEFQDFALWLLPNEPPGPEWARRLEETGIGARIRVRPTGPGNPARKRNVAMRESGGGIFALIDSDAYPRADWLSNALPLLNDSVAIVTGPNISPPDDPVSRQAASHVMESRLGFYAGYIRHVPRPRRFVDEMPTCNMIFTRQEGLFFHEDLNTSEDMVFCRETAARGKRILYDPGVVVFHHRRKVFRPFMLQFFNYGRDKGRLFRAGMRGPNLGHAVPPLFLFYTLSIPAAAAACLIAGIAPAWMWLYLAPLLFYLAAVAFESIRLSSSAMEMALTCPAFVAAHLSFGCGALKGLLCK